MTNEIISPFQKLNLTSSSSLQEGETQQQHHHHLDQCIRSLFLNSFVSSTIECAKQQLDHFRMAILSPERMIRLIDDGYTIDEISTFIAKKHELQEVFKSVEGDIRDLALGVSVILVGYQIQMTSKENSADDQTTSINLMNKRLQELIKVKELQHNSMHISNFSLIDYGKVFKHVEDEIFNGNLAGDPAWIDKERSKKTNRKVGWTVRLHEGLVSLTEIYDDAAYSMDWSETILHDSIALSRVNPQFLTQFIRKSYDPSLSKILHGPVRAGQQEGFNTQDATRIANIGIRLRTQVVKNISSQAFDSLIKKDFEMAQILYRIAFEAGSNDPTIMINRAAALFDLERYEESQTACTLALSMMEAVLNTDSTRRRSSQDESSRTQVHSSHQHPLLAELTKVEYQRWTFLNDTLHQSSRTREYKANKQEIDSLRWRAYIRRGRAYKQILQALGAIADGNSVNPETAINHNTDDDEFIAQKRGEALLFARSDFACALMLDPLQNLPRQELSQLTIHPLQRRPSTEHSTLSLSNIHSVLMQRRSISL